MNNKENKRVITVLSLASLLHDIGSDMVFSVWPIFVTSILGANMTVLGFIDGLGDAIVSISQAVSGYISDKIRKRKIFVLLGYFFGGISRIGYALSPTWQWLVPFRLLDRSGKIRGAPRDAIISEVSDHKNRGKHFGTLRAMDNLGATVGILIALFFFGSLGFNNLFVLAAIPSFIAVFLLLVFIKEPNNGQKIHKGISLKNTNPNLKLFILLSAVFSLGSFSYSFLILYANRSGYPISTTIIFYLIFSLVAALTSYFFGNLSDQIGRKKVILISYGFWAAVSLLFIFLNSLAGVVLGFIFYGLHKAALDPVQKTFVAELAQKDYLASTLGGFQMIIGLFALPASLMAGFLWDRFGSTVPFYLSLFLTMTSSLLLLFVREKAS